MPDPTSDSSAKGDGQNAQSSSPLISKSSDASPDGVISSAISNINQEFKEKEVQQRARELGISYVDVSVVPMNPDNLALISPEDSEKGQVIVFFRVGQKLRIALVDPENEEAQRIMRELENKNFVLNLNLCSAENLKKAQQIYQSHYREKREIIADVQHENVANVQAAISSLEEMPEIMEKMKSDEALNVLHKQVLKMGVSDLHLEPQQHEYRVRARIDGVLSSFFVIPSQSKLSDMLVKQIKYNSRLKLNITNAPQDGQYFFRASDRAIDVRVSTLPTKNGESVVMRFLDPKKGIVELPKLGLSEFATQKIETALKSPNGMILVTGPTGSGKTTTLYSSLHTINSPEKKIITLEDPVEYHLPGILQSQIDEGAGYTFASGLRSILRQDPDVVMVGEIRDLQTAETAVQASLTGHLVFSTLHTNSAIDAIPRFLNMGVKNYVLAPSLRAVVAQRLVRKICAKCTAKREMTVAEKHEAFEVLKKMGERGQKIPEVSAHVQEGTGCKECSDTGFRGEMALAEVLVVGEEMQTGIAENASVQTLRSISYTNGFRTMWEEGILAVIEGKTTLSEVRRSVGM